MGIHQGRGFYTNQSLKMIIYRLFNKATGKSYIGQTVRPLKVRVYWHKYSAKKGHTSYIHRSIDKHGIGAFECEQIDTAESKKDLNEKEKYWIKKLNTLAPAGYNFTPGGTGGPTMTGRKHSPETIKKMSEAHKGCKNPFFGLKHTTTSKRKISKSLEGNNRAKGMRHTEEFKKDRGAAWVGDKNPMRDPVVLEKRRLLKERRQADGV